MHQLGLEMAGVWKRAGHSATLELHGRRRALRRAPGLPGDAAGRPATGSAWWPTRACRTGSTWWRTRRPPTSAWARDAGMRYLAGYPLLVEARSMGVLAVGTRRPLTPGGARGAAAAGGRDRPAPGARGGAHGAHRERGAPPRGDGEPAGRPAGGGRARLHRVGERGGRAHLRLRAGELLGTAPERPDAGVHGPRLPGRPARGLQARPSARSPSGRAGGRTASCSPSSSAMYEFKGDPGRRFGGHIRDLSERREVERLKKEFVAVVSHELRTPLTSIRGSLSLLANGVLGELPGRGEGGGGDRRAQHGAPDAPHQRHPRPGAAGSRAACRCTCRSIR